MKGDTCHSLKKIGGIGTSGSPLSRTLPVDPLLHSRPRTLGIMTSSHRLFIQLQVLLTAVVVGFSGAGVRPTSRMVISNDLSSSGDVKCSDVEQVRHCASIRPAAALLYPVIAASVFASLSTTAAHADTFANHDAVAIIHSKTKTASIQSTNPTIIQPSLQLSRSSLANPIGEMQDGSDTGIQNSFGQWFFLLYIIVSLLAGGKEVLGRIQKQMDKDS